MQIKILISTIIFCMVFFNLAQAGQSQQERKLSQNLNELIETMEKRGKEVKKIIDLTQPSERINITEITEKIVKLISAIDLAKDLLGGADVKTFGITRTITQGALVAARALDLTGMLYEEGHRYVLKGYIEDRDKFKSTSEAIQEAMQVIKADGHTYSPNFNNFETYVLRHKSWYINKAVRKVSESRDIEEGYRNLIESYEFDYHCFKLITDENHLENYLTEFKDTHKHISGSTTVILMDVSGSMGKKGKLKTAKAAANSFIDSASEDDWIALSSFESNARSVVGLLPMDIGKNELKKGVKSLSARGGTNIGAGLEVGRSQLFSDPPFPYNPVIILLSDGKHETGKLWPAVEKCKQWSVKIYTVPYGKDADHETLQKIARLTDGRVLPADSKNLSYVYHRLNSQIQNRSTLFAGNDILKPGQLLSYSTHVDPDVSKLTFFTSWQGSRVLMELTDPAGNKIIPGKSFGRYIEEPTYSIFEIDSQPGPWQMSIEGRDFPAEGEQVNISISGQSSLYTNFLSFQPEYSLGSKVPIAVEVANVEGLEKTPLTDVKVTAQIRKPQAAIAEKTDKGMKINLEGLIKSALDKKDITLPLYGSGAQSDHRRSSNAGFGCAATSIPARTYEHPDIPGMKADDVFANTFYDTNVKGSYLVNVTIEGMLDGQKIKRYITESFQVGPIEDNTVTLSDFLRFKR